MMIIDKKYIAASLGIIGLLFGLSFLQGKKWHLLFHAIKRVIKQLGQLKMFIKFILWLFKTCMPGTKE